MNRLLTIPKIDPRTKRYIKLSKFPFHCLPCSENISTLEQICTSQNRKLHISLRQERSRDQTFALCVDIRDISSQNYFPFGRNYISITFVPGKIQSRINTSYRFSINASLKRPGQSNFDDGTTSPTFFVQILTLWNHVSMYLEYGDHKF